MEHAHTGQLAGVPAVRHRLDQLRRAQTEFGFLPPGVLPVALADVHQAHAQANDRLHPDPVRLFQQQRQLRELFHHDMHFESQGLTHQRQAQIFTILVAVADHRVTGIGQRQHRQQLGLGAGFQADPVAVFTGADDLMHHPALLVHLDWIYRRVLSPVLQILDGGREGAGQTPHPVLENAGKPGQHRRPQPGLPAGFQHHFQRRFRAFIALRPHAQAPPVIDAEIAIPPAIHIVDGVKGAFRGGAHRLVILGVEDEGSPNYGPSWRGGKSLLGCDLAGSGFAPPVGSHPGSD